MPDEALTNAFAELHALQDDMMRVDAQIAQLQDSKTKIADRVARARQFIVAWHEFSGKQPPTFDGDTKIAFAVGQATGSAAVTAVGRDGANPKKEIVATAALELIRKRGVPIPRPELHELLKQRGLEVRGIDPLVTLSTMLWRAGPRIGLIHIKGFGYWDRDKPCSLARYIPGNNVDNSETLDVVDIDQMIQDNVNEE